MLTIFQAIILGLTQGITELFPISSLGHSVLIPALFNWNVSQNDEFFLIFLVATHFATALVLFIYFWSDWKKIIAGFIRSIKKEARPNDTDAKIAWLLIVATVPAGLIGLILESTLKKALSNGLIVAIVLILNGFLLLGAEYLRKKRLTVSEVNKRNIDYTDERVAKLSWVQSMKIGLMQCLALIPGFSRTGSTLAGGLLIGLDHEESVRFSFLLATPIIFAAAILKLPKLITLHNGDLILISFIGAISAAIAAYFSVRFLTNYFKTKTLFPFAVYCIVIGIISIMILK